ncbi:BPI fold-containing family B member 1 [Sciurus carolinensis]|uniref:BPI fold-containing family B member 1 n=1 Tax=Sciurus carolinensis TaxID=30640 RepID=UPI001FB3E532|nr:BPI fold-containing family B member 1 [Sciurus carolinensis]
MATLWTCTLTLLCGFLAATMAQATFSTPAVLILGPEVIKERLTQELQDHNATAVLQQLPLLSAMRESSRRSFLLSGLLDTILRHVVWLKITSAAIPQLQLQPSAQDQELVVKIPLDLVAGLNTPLVKSVVELHMQSEVQAHVTATASPAGPALLVLSDCFNSQGSLRISLLRKLSFSTNLVVKQVTSLLMPALPRLVKTQLCPVIQGAFEDTYAGFLRLVRVPIPLSPGDLLFDLLSSAIEDNAIQLNLQAKLLDSQREVTHWLNDTSASLAVPALGSAPFTFVLRQDVLNAVVAALFPPEKLAVPLDYVLPDLAGELKSGIKGINEQAAGKLDRTQLLKLQTRKTPQLLLSRAGAQATQLIVLDLFPTNKAQRPLFTLGIEAKSEAQFYPQGDRLALNFNNISIDRIKLMNSDMKLFNPELLKDTLSRILESTLLSTENGKLRAGIPMSMVKALGYESVTLSLTTDALVLTPADS